MTRSLHQQTEALPQRAHDERNFLMTHFLFCYSLNAAAVFPIASKCSTVA